MLVKGVPGICNLNKPAAMENWCHFSSRQHPHSHAIKTDLLDSPVQTVIFLFTIILYIHIIEYICILSNQNFGKHV